MIEGKQNEITFPGMEHDEHVQFYVRRHPMSVLWFIILTFIMAIVPVLIILAFHYINQPSAPGELPPINGEAYTSYRAFSVLLTSVYYMSILLFFLVWWMDYYFDILFVTNKRIVDTEQKGVFNRMISELPMLRIQDVSGEVKGVIPTLFGFGNVVVQTAATQEQFVIRSVPEPHEISRRIMEIHNKSLDESDAERGMRLGEGMEISEREPIYEATHNHPSTPRIGEMLVADGLITQDQLIRALNDQQKNHGRLGSTLVKLGFITEEDLCSILGEQTRHVPLDLTNVDLDSEVVHIIPEHLARVHHCIAVSRQGKILTIACANPHEEEVMQEIGEAIGYTVAPVISPEISIQKAQDKYYGKTLSGDQE